MTSLGLALAALGVVAAVAAAGTRVHVSPGAGPPTTRFTLRFRAPERTGRVGSIRRVDRLYISGPRQVGCISSARLRIIPVSQGTQVTITVRPGPGARWCLGRFRGRIVRTETLVCPRACAGPSLPPPLTIARFAFRVTKPATEPPRPALSGGPAVTINAG